MLPFTTDDLTSLLGAHEPPCISLYLPTHRTHPEREGDPIRYRNQLKELKASLEQKYPKRATQERLEPFEKLAYDYDFWNHRSLGLGILSTAEKFEVFDLQRPVKELVVVADSFHIKPLMRQLQSADHYQILSVGMQGGRLFEGNRDGLDPVEVSDVISAPLAREPRQSHKDKSEADLLNYLRTIDAAVLEEHSKPSGLPLLVVALPEMLHAFRTASRNPFVVGEGMALSPESIDLEELRLQAWQKFEPVYLERLAGLIDRFNAARAKGMGADIIDDVAAAAAAGRIETLLVEADREIPGKLDSATGAITPTELCDPEVDDLLDDLAESVLRAGGAVIVVPAERMPGESGLAAILRY